MEREQPFVQLENISKWYGKSVILNKINLNIPYGCIYGIIGKSGSGKSTLLSIIIGFLKQSEGKVYFQSHDVYNNLEEMQQQFGFAAQEVSFYPRLNVTENLKYFGRLYNLTTKQIREKIPELLNLVNLTGNEYLQGWKLSAGMQKRLDIACALMHEPKVLLLDEPTEDLDPSLRLELLDLIKRINIEKNVTVILTSHLLNEVEYVCDKVAILHNHEIAASGKINELKENYSKEHEVGIGLEEGDKEEFVRMLKKIPNVSKIVVRQGKIYIYTNKGADILKRMLGVSLKPQKKFKVSSISLSKPSLEEVFEDLTKKELVVEDVKSKKSKSKQKTTEIKEEVKEKKILGIFKFRSKEQKEEEKFKKQNQEAEKVLEKIARNPRNTKQKKKK